MGVKVGVLLFADDFVGVSEYGEQLPHHTLLVAHHTLLATQHTLLECSSHSRA